MQEKIVTNCNKLKNINSFTIKSLSRTQIIPRNIAKCKLGDASGKLKDFVKDRVPSLNGMDKFIPVFT